MSACNFSNLVQLYKKKKGVYKRHVLFWLLLDLAGAYPSLDPVQRSAPIVYRWLGLTPKENKTHTDIKKKKEKHTVS